MEQQPSIDDLKLDLGSEELGGRGLFGREGAGEVSFDAPINLRARDGHLDGHLDQGEAACLESADGLPERVTGVLESA